MTKKKPRAPKHLRPETGRWWSSVQAEFVLEPHHTRLLTMASESFDRAQEARERIAQDGAYVSDRFNQLRAHPAIAVERDCRIAFARLVRELDLDVDPPKESRPPMLSRYGGN
jgi:phage terminase small subunit